VIVGYTDTHCETEINECLSDPCQGRGNCSDLLDAFNCSCYSGLVQFILICISRVSASVALNDDDDEGICRARHK